MIRQRLKDVVLNRPWASLHGGSLNITLTVLLKIEKESDINKFCFYIDGLLKYTFLGDTDKKIYCILAKDTDKKYIVY